MSCQTVRKTISALVDGRLPTDERDSVSQHLAGCRECAAHSDELWHLRKFLRQLPAAEAPERLTTQLQVIASRERAYRLATINFSAAVRYWTGKARLIFDNMMKPLALPFAGGLASALCLFSMLVPTLGFRHNFANDVPTVLYTEACVEEMAPFTFARDEGAIELTIDEKGRIVDYAVPAGIPRREVMSNIGNMMLFTSFTPATWFGHPTAGKLRVSFRRSHIVVKG
jgi:hypothetical protein